MAEILMDNEVVRVGDSVYDVRYGAGRITALNVQDRRFTVKFQSPDTELVYKPNGTRGTQRRSLFWKNPILVVPNKDEGLWQEASSLARRVVEAMRRVGLRDK